MSLRGCSPSEPRSPNSPPRADIQLTALTRALDVGTRVAYLDQSGGGGDDAGVDFHEFQPESAVKLACALLYREYSYLYTSPGDGDADCWVREEN